MRVLRAARGLSQVELGKLARIDPKFISHIETGKMFPNPDWEARIKEALDWPEQGDEAFAILTGEAEKPA